MTTLKIHDEKEKLKLKKSTLRSLEQYASEFLQFSFRSAKKHQTSAQTCGGSNIKTILDKLQKFNLVRRNMYIVVCCYIF